MMWRSIARFLWQGLVLTGFATHLAPPGGWPPEPVSHPERLIPHVLPDATERALWDQIEDVFVADGPDAGGRP